jgi:hypothetical protein
MATDREHLQAAGRILAVRAKRRAEEALRSTSNNNTDVLREIERLCEEASAVCFSEASAQSLSGTAPDADLAAWQKEQG